MGTRRANGEGTIYRRKDTRWRGQITTGKRPDGKLKRKSVTGETRKEVAEKLAQIKVKLRLGTYSEPTETTVKEWLNRWLEMRKPPILEPKTWEGYEIQARVHIIPKLGHIKVQDLQTYDIQLLLNEKTAAGKSPRTVEYIYTTLHGALEQAVRENVIPRNPAKFVELPKDEQEREDKMNPLTREQARRLLEKAKDDRYYAVVHLALSTGMRKGEILGLRWCDVNLEAGSITVRKQLQHQRGKGLVMKKVKTKSSRRTVAINEEVVKVLRTHKAEQNKERLSVGEGYRNTHDLVFTTKIGTPIDSKNFDRKHFKPLLKKAKLPNIRFHDLRHTFATLSLEAGVNPKSIQKILGHSTISTTLDTYSHVTEDMQEEAAETIGRVLSG